MKSIRSLFLIAIGMIAFTATAHTAKLEQKQNTVLVSEYKFQANDVSVNYVYVSNDTIVFECALSTHFVKIENYNPNTFAIITDVGWSFTKRQCKDIPYKEKLLENYNLHFKNKLLAQLLVRDNS